MIKLRVNIGNVYYEGFGVDYYDVEDWYIEEFETMDRINEEIEDLKTYYNIYSIEEYNNKIVVNTY